MSYDARGAYLRLGGKPLAHFESGVARLITNTSGVTQVLLGISEQSQKVSVRLANHAQRVESLRPNQRITL